MLSFFSRGAKPRSFSLFVRPRFSRLFRRPSFGFVYWTTIAAMVIFPTYVLYTAFHAEETGSQAKAHSQAHTRTESRLSRELFATPFHFWGTNVALAAEGSLPTTAPNCEGKPNAIPQRLEVHHLDDLPPLGVRDPDWLDAMERIVKESVKDGSWEREIRAQQEAFLTYADAPKGVRLPMVRESQFVEIETPLAALKRDRAKVGASNALLPSVATALEGFSRTYLFVDGSVEAQRLFALSWLKDHPHPYTLVLTGGSISAFRSEFAPLFSSHPEMKLYFDQWGRFSAKCQVRFSPTLVEMTPETLTLWTPALTQDGDLLDALPEKVAALMRH